MIPVVTPLEMAAVDAASTVPVEELVRRAGTAVAWAARRRLGGTYGKRVVVVVGTGNNGADGRVAAAKLRSWGVRVTLIDALAQPPVLPASDLVIDAAFGTGITRPYHPGRSEAPVLAVDIPSGVDGLTGEAVGTPLQAVETVTFQACKPGLLFPPGADLAGDVTLVDLGLDVSGAACTVIEGADVAAWVPKRPTTAHKWRAGCWVIGGSPAMTGAPRLAASAANRVGAGMVRLSIPGERADGPIEAVHHDLPVSGWERGLSTDLDRFSSVVLGPGLGRARSTVVSIRAALAVIDVPVVLDGDGLAALADHGELLTARPAATVLTPHDGEFEYLAGARPGSDRIADARRLAGATGAVVLLKGPTTVVADPEGRAILATVGDQRLATAGTGDVLAGLVGGLLAQGMAGFEAAACAAWIHGAAGNLCGRHLVASDLLDKIGVVLDATDVG